MSQLASREVRYFRQYCTAVGAGCRRVHPRGGPPGAGPRRNLWEELSADLFLSKVSFDFPGGECWTPGPRHGRPERHARGTYSARGPPERTTILPTSTERPGMPRAPSARAPSERAATGHPCRCSATREQQWPPMPTPADVAPKSPAAQTLSRAAGDRAARAPHRRSRSHGLARARTCHSTAIDAHAPRAAVTARAPSSSGDCTCSLERWRRSGDDAHAPSSSGD